MALLKFTDPAKRGFHIQVVRCLQSFPLHLLLQQLNEEVRMIVTVGENKKEQGPYVKFSSKAKLVIVRYAAENSIAASLCHFATRFPDLKQSSVRTLRNSYQTELS